MLQQLSGCQISTRPLRGEAPKEEQEATTEVRINCSAPRHREREARIATCQRAAQMICMDGTTVEEAWRQAEAERELQEQREAEEQEAEDLETVARQIRIEWPEFALEAVKNALVANDMDEDRAIEALHVSGYTSPVVVAAPAPAESVVRSARTPVSSHRNAAPHSAEREDFPTLGGGASAKAPKEITLGLRENVWRGARCASATGIPELRSEAAFPALPTPQACPTGPCHARPACGRAQLGGAARARVARN